MTRVEDFLSTDLCKNDSYYVRNAPNWSGLYLTAFILFHIMNMSLLIYASVACFVPPISKKQRKDNTCCFKFSKVMSFFDVSSVSGVFGSKKGKKRRINDGEVEEEGYDQKKTVTGSLVTLFMIWFMFGALIYSYSAAQPSLSSMIQESQDASSALHVKSAFKAAAIVKLRLTKNDCANYFAKTTIDIEGADLRISPAQYHSFLSGYDYYCFIYREWQSEANPNYPLRQNAVKISLNIQEVKTYEMYSTSAFSVVSLPWNTREESLYNDYPPTLEETQSKSTVKYLLERSQFCTNLKPNYIHTPISVSAEPKSFQYPFRIRHWYSVDKASVMSNLIHFPQQFVEPETPSYSDRTSAGITINFTPRRVYYIGGQSQTSQNAFMTVFIIICTLVALTWVKNLALGITAHFQRSAAVRVLTVVLLLVISVGFYGLLGYEISLGNLFEDELISSFVMSGIIHSSMYAFYLFLHVVIFQVRYKKMAKEEAEDEVIPLFDSSSNIVAVPFTAPQPPPVLHHAPPMVHQPYPMEGYHAQSSVQPIYPREHTIPYQHQQQ